MCVCDGSCDYQASLAHVQMYSGLVANLHIRGIPVIYSTEAIKLKDVSRVPTWIEPKQLFDLW